MAVQWTLVLLSGALEELSDLAPSKTTLRFERKRGAVIKAMEVPHDTEGAAQFAAARLAGTPILLCYRRDSQYDENNPIPRLACKPDTIRNTLDGDGAPVMSITWADPLGVPLRTSTITGTYSQASSLTVSDIIDAENADVPSGLRVGSVDSGAPSRDSNYTLQPISTAIYTFADLGDFVTQITYLDPRDNAGDIAELAIVLTAGSDLTDTVRLEAGRGTLANTLAVSEETFPPVNVATATVRHPGAFPGDPNTGATVAATETDAASILKFGKFEFSKDVGTTLNNADLADQATAFLRPEWTSSVEFTPNPDLAPQPFVDYFTSDTLGFLADSYLLQIDTSEQLIAFEIDLDENLQEVAHRLEYGEPRRDEAQIIGALAERVYFLEHGT